MMKPLLALAAASQVIGAAAPANRIYEYRATVIRDGAVIATPRLQAAAGSTARLESDDGKALAWSATFTATPDPHRAGIASLSWTAQITDRAPDGKQTIRRGAATIAISDPGRANLPIGQHDTRLPSEIRIALASTPVR